MPERLLERTRSKRGNLELGDRVDIVYSGNATALSYSFFKISIKIFKDLRVSFLCVNKTQGKLLSQS